MIPDGCLLIGHLDSREAKVIFPWNKVIK
jgi:hypothetical protein